MGWASAGPIFDRVAQALIDTGAGADQLRNVLGPLIDELKSEGWDTEHESLEDFKHHPAIVELFAERGIE